MLLTGVCLFVILLLAIMRYYGELILLVILPLSALYARINSTEHMSTIAISLVGILPFFIINIGNVLKKIFCCFTPFPHHIIFLILFWTIMNIPHSVKQLTIWKALNLQKFQLFLIIITFLESTLELLHLLFYPGEKKQKVLLNF